MSFLEKLLMVQLFGCHGYKKWKHFELFYSLHFNNKSWLLRRYVYNWYTLMLFENLIYVVVLALLGNKMKILFFNFCENNFNEKS